MQAKVQPKILVAPSAYKGSLNSLEISRAIISGLNVAAPFAEIAAIPLADGGDGTITALHTCLSGVIEELEVIGPLNNPVKAHWLRKDNCAILELAACCGLATIKGRSLQPLLAHTFALGEVIKDCLSKSCQKIIIGLGGSASTDGGAAALTALGIKFLDARKKPLPYGGGFLAGLDTIDLSELDERIFEKEIELLTDVCSPLLGPEGAAYVFAPQKGASLEEVEVLELGLTQLADKIKNLTHEDLRDKLGSGAAGGTAFGLASLLKAHISPGFARIAKILGLEEKIKNADLVITAEGRLDLQSFQGKATGELARLCKNMNKPLVVLPASCDDKIDWHSFGITDVRTTASSNSLANSKDITKTVIDLVMTTKICNT